MEHWQHIINASMMGTEKKNLGAGDLPASLQEPASLILDNQASDNEEKFLQLAAVVFNYRQCGVTPLKKEQVTLPLAAAEELPYCSPTAQQVLKDILSEDSMPLLRFWLGACATHRQLVQPDLVAHLLEIGAAQKSLQTLVAACCGKRGEWLSQFNHAWNFSTSQPPEELWQTGTPEQRRSVLKTMREEDPAMARTWVQGSWSQEDAAAKTSFLEILERQVSEDDLDFLETASADKSKKVKEAALYLLKKIPGSPVVQQYQQVLEQAVSLRKEKTMLGLGSKTVLHLELPANIEESVFKTGIDKLSSSKEMSDDAYVLSQMISAVPPSFWEKHLQLKPEDTIQLFQKDAVGKKMIPALVTAIRQFRDAEWAKAMVREADVFYIDVIPLLPVQQQGVYMSKYFERYPEEIIQFAMGSEVEWNLELALMIIGHATKHMYKYNRSFYHQNVHLIPVAALPWLSRFEPADLQWKNAWEKLHDDIMKLLTLKERTLKVFN